MNVLITGISSGIGLATAKFLANRGFQVFGTMRAPDKYEELILELKKDYSNSIQIVKMDVTSDESVTLGINSVLDKIGFIDILICNAGILVYGSIEEVPMEVIKQQYDTNVFGALRTVKAVLPTMRERKTGKIILVSSLAGLLSIPFSVNYSASKYAINAITEGLKQELKPFGIKVSAVRPGDINTNIQKNTISFVPVRSPYNPINKICWQVMNDEVNNGPTPDLVAKKIYDIIKSSNPKTFYTAAGGVQSFIPYVNKIISSGLKEKLVRKFYRLDK
jgi:short-subunit dehydrogenase